MGRRRIRWQYLLRAATTSSTRLVLAWHCWRPRLSARPGTRARPEGHPNATRVAALINAGWLLLLELLVADSAADRLFTRTPQVGGLAVLIVSGIAALVMAVGVLILRSDGDDEDGERDLSVAAVLLDTIADASAAAGVAVIGGVILASGGWYWLDPAVALIIALVISWHAAALIRKVLHRRRSPAAVGSKS